MVATTWSPTDKSKYMSLSNNNLTVTASNTRALVRATNSKTGGKWFWEVKLTAGAPYNTPGIALSSVPLSGDYQTVLGYSEPNCAGIYHSGRMMNGNGYITPGGSVAVGGSIGIALDLESSPNTIEYFVNGVSVASPMEITFSGRPIFPAWQSADGNDTVTVNFGATSFDYPSSVPSGFRAYDDVVVYPTTPQEVVFPALSLYGKGSISSILTTQTTPSGTYIYYAVSFDGGTTYKSRKSGSWTTITDVHADGMTKAQIEAITVSQWDSIFTATTLKIKTSFKTDNISNTPSIDSIEIDIPDTYDVGSYYTYTGSQLEINTLSWKDINSMTITQTEPTNTNIRYAFSNDGKSTWKVYKGSIWQAILLSNLGADGMSKSEVEALDISKWREMLWNSTTYTLDIVSNLFSSTKYSTPLVDAIHIDYSDIITPVLSNYITTPTPVDSLHRFKWNGTSYDLLYVQGFMFKDNGGEYFSTANGLILRYLDMALLYAGQESEPIKIILENTFDITANNITISAYTSNMPVNCTVTFSLVESPFSDSENIVVGSLSSFGTLEFYIKLHTLTTSVGEGNFDIRVKGEVII